MLVWVYVVNIGVCIAGNNAMEGLKNESQGYTSSHRLL